MRYSRDISLWYFLRHVHKALYLAFRITTLQKAWNVYSICSLYSSMQVIEILPFLSLISTDIYFKIGSKNFKSAKPKNTVINAIAGEIILFGKFILFNKWISKENTTKNNINVTINNGLWRIKNLYITYSIQKKTNIEIKHKKEI